MRNLYYTVKSVAVLEHLVHLFFGGGGGGFTSVEKVELKGFSSASLVCEVHDEYAAADVSLHGGGGGLTIEQDLKLSGLCPCTKVVRSSFNIDFAFPERCLLAQVTNIPCDVDLGFAPLTTEHVQSTVWS